LVKFFAGTPSGSVAITADAFNNLSDAGSSVVTLLGFRIAAKAPDPGHPFGHGRAEYLSGLAVSMLILLMGVELAKESLNKILHPALVEFSWLVIGILAASICVKLYMAMYNRSLGKKLSAPALLAAAADSLGDCMSTSAVLVATLIGHYFQLPVDGWVGILVALFIFKGGIDAAKDTIDPLLGKPPTPEFVKEIENLVMAHKEISGIHDLVVHDSGPGRVILRRSGSVNSQMVFEEGRQHTSLYETPYGELSVDIQTSRLLHNLTERGGLMEIKYSIAVEHVVTGRNCFKIRVRRK